MSAAEFAMAGGKQFMTNAAWENRMNSSIEAILELLEQNVKWWEQAAITCEQTAAQVDPTRKEEWWLMGAVYRERAEKHSRLLEHLCEKRDGERPFPGGRTSGQEAAR
jgi:hypothetical protein